MPDVFDQTMRSLIMRKVRSQGNESTELRLIRLFRENDITGWKRFYLVKGRPDFVFLKKKIALFVDGCFWHGHDCRNTRPKDNEKYWNEKRNRNMSRDKKITALFEKRGWTVVRIWECELKKKNIPKVLEKLKGII